MKNAAFSRVKAYFAKVYAAMMLPTLDQRKAAIAQAGVYKSRGHGLGLAGNKHSHRSVAQDKRDAQKKRNRAK